MAYETWPASLPATPQPGSEVPMDDNTANFTPDEGPDIRYRKSTLDAGEATMTFRLSKAQAITLRDFYKITLKSGAKPFTGLNDVLDEPHNWRFKSKPKIMDTAAGFFEASCELEVVP